MPDPVEMMGDEDEYEEEYEDEYEEELDDQAIEAAEAAAAAAASGAAAAAAAAPQLDDDELEDEEEDEDEDEEEDEEDEGAGVNDDDIAQDWTALPLMPEGEQVLDILRQLREDDPSRRQLTLLLLGKSGAGKSSTLNSLLGEKAAPVAAFKLQPDTESSTPYVRTVVGQGEGLDGFRVKIIDTCGLEDPEQGDTVNYAALERIAEDIKGVPIDAVLYVDRLDLYRVEPLDRRIVQCIGDALGRGVWAKTLLVLTHGNLPMPPPGTTFETFSERRVQLLRGAVRGRFFKPALPAQLAENGEGCRLDAERCRVLPDGGRWLVDLWGAAADMALGARPFVWKKGMAWRANAGFKWLIPLVAYGQYLAWKVLLVPRLRREEDRLSAADEAAWQAKAAERKRLGIGPPLRPSARDAWRLEQMYDDD